MSLESDSEPEARESGEWSTPARDADRADHSPWTWLLLVPIVVPLLTVLYNRKEPELLGFPFFYWFQLALIAIGVVTTTVVYQMTKSRS